jgi:ABC-2 type transport system permease protein
MRTIGFLLRKEFIQIRRNRTLLAMMIAVPIVQMLILVNAATLEMKNISICFVDQDLSSASRRLQSKFEGSPFFIVTGNTFDLRHAEHQLKNGSADLVFHIPRGFEKQLEQNREAGVQVLINGIDGMKAGIANSYALQITAGFHKEFLVQRLGVSNQQLSQNNINIIPAFWFNPELNYKIFMVPAILALLVTLVGMMMAVLNIVREKEMGTIEQINVTPVRKYHFIIGKLLPFWIIAMFELAFGLAVGKLLFQIPFAGSLWLLFFAAGIYLLVVQSFSLLISNVASTQQQAMFVMFFFLIVFMMMSGIFTPAESMPDWAQAINKLNPIAYFMNFNRMILIKGSGFWDILPGLLHLAAMAAVLIPLAAWRYKKTV